MTTVCGYFDISSFTAFSCNWPMVCDRVDLAMPLPAASRISR
jgi:hypothetical protein